HEEPALIFGWNDGKDFRRIENGRQGEQQRQDAIDDPCAPAGQSFEEAGHALSFRMRMKKAAIAARRTVSRLAGACPGHSGGGGEKSSSLAANEAAMALSVSPPTLPSTVSPAAVWNSR